MASKGISPEMKQDSSSQKNGSPSKQSDASPAGKAMGSGKGSNSKRRKVGTACIYCRRSHMTCDDGRPCKRCIKRDIGHLCHDESTQKGNNGQAPSLPDRSNSPPHEILPTTYESNEKTKSSQVVPSHGSQPTASALPQSYRNETASITPAPYSSSSTLSGLQTSSNNPVAPLPQDASVLLNAAAAPSGDLSLSLGPNMPTPSTNFPSSWGFGSGGGSVLGGAGFLGLGGGTGGTDGDGMGASGDAAGGNEFNILSEFLESLDGSNLTTPGTSVGPQGLNMTTMTSTSNIAAPTTDTRTSFQPTSDISGQPLPFASTSTAQVSRASSSGAPDATEHARQAGALTGPTSEVQTNSGAYAPSIKGFSTKTERFFLTAADQNDGTRDERLGKVIQAKYDAGLLRPYNHVNGYARLNRWMEQNVSQASRRRILKPLSIFRPAFRAVAQSLTNVDLIYIEEAFERLLLDYDRVFSTQGIPACLWRRTGEIYKGNKEFAELVGVGIEALRDGRCTIYEFMEEESAVNYWEKYGAVSFDPGQKAVLTSCVLKAKETQVDRAHPPMNGEKTKQNEEKTTASLSRSPTKPTKPETESGKASEGSLTDRPVEAGLQHIPCCFSFTIRRDAWSIPCLIVGNFLPIPS